MNGIGNWIAPNLFMKTSLIKSKEIGMSQESAVRQSICYSFFLNLTASCCFKHSLYR